MSASSHIDAQNLSLGDAGSSASEDGWNSLDEEEAGPDLICLCCAVATPTTAEFLKHLNDTHSLNLRIIFKSKGQRTLSVTFFSLCDSNKLFQCC
jgi:hypothetical protein